MLNRNCVGKWKSNNSVWTLSFDALTALSRTLDIGYITITWGWFRMPSLILWVAFQQYGPSIPGPNLSAHVSSKPVTSPWLMDLGLRGDETASFHASFVTTHQPLLFKSASLSRHIDTLNNSFSKGKY
ncbi:hypothetical protein SDJN03_11235, partial [Cucurbita argyrosperma subsp. sororia]